MRVVVDTNTLASGALAKAETPPTAIVDAWRHGVFTLVISPDILDELARTLAKPYFAERLSSDDVTAFLELLNGMAVPVSVPGAVTGIATHPEDDRILEAAIVANASHLVTGDKKLQDLTTFQGVTIVSPRQFVTILDEEGGEHS